MKNERACHRHVLVVDDEPGIRTFVAMALEGEGYTVSTAENGARALDRIAQHQPRMVLLDLQMPVMDGWESMRRIRALDAAIPVVIMTANARRDIGPQLHQAAGFLAKPFTLDTLIHTVESVDRPDETR